MSRPLEEMYLFIAARLPSIPAKLREELVRIAKGAPTNSQAFKEGSRFARMYGLGGMSAVAFAKTARWLAMIRLDYGDAEFERTLLGTGLAQHEASRELIEELLTLTPQADRSLVQQAIGFALVAHAGQFRIGADPQANHVLRVGIAAAKYARVHAPEHFRSLVIAGVLHDTLEDTSTTDDELRQRFGNEVSRIVRALSHEQEEEPDEIYLGRVAAGGMLAVLVKRCDRLDNMANLASASAEFRARKLSEIRAALPIWQRMDPEGAREIEAALCTVYSSSRVEKYR